MIRRLDPEKDEELYRIAFLWDIDAPRWYRQMDQVFRPDSVEEYLELAKGDDQADIGIWDDQKFIGLLTLSLRAKGIHEVHLSAKRGASIETLIHAGICIRDQFLEQVGGEVFAWAAERNRGVKKLLYELGFLPHNVTLVKGEYNPLVVWGLWVLTI